MPLPSAGLEAFTMVARELHFSRAAKRLGLTQSALSLRVRKLEDEIGATLFVRDRAGTRLTEAGERLLGYCRLQDSLESELLGSLRPGSSAGLTGILRIGGFSSITRSVLLPALAPLLRHNPAIELHLSSRELPELPGMLRRGELDFAVLDRRLEDARLEAMPLGEEEYVLVSPAKRQAGPFRILDHDESDETSTRFFRLQKPPRDLLPPRIYLDEIYGIIDGVRHGLGSAVAPRHLIAGQPGLSVEPGYRALRVPVVLHFVRQSHRSRLNAAVLDALRAGAARILGAKPRD